MCCPHILFSEPCSSWCMGGISIPHCKGPACRNIAYDAPRAGILLVAVVIVSWETLRLHHLGNILCGHMKLSWWITGQNSAQNQDLHKCLSSRAPGGTSRMLWGRGISRTNQCTESNEVSAQSRSLWLLVGTVLKCFRTHCYVYFCELTPDSSL